VFHISTSVFSFREQRALLEKCARTTLSSKLIARQRDFFSKMVVDTVLMLGELLPLNMIGIKKITGGSLEVRFDFCIIAEEIYLYF
jgi:T-complex protein 1 subunit eta